MSHRSLTAKKNPEVQSTGFTNIHRNYGENFIFAVVHRSAIGYYHRPQQRNSIMLHVNTRDMAALRCLIEDNESNMGV